MISKVSSVLILRFDVHMVNFRLTTDISWMPLVTLAPCILKQLSYFMKSSYHKVPKKCTGSRGIDIRVHIMLGTKW